MLQKRLEHGYNGYQVPFVPRAARSARKRGPAQKKAEDNQMCAFDLLASLAGKILLEGGRCEDKNSVKDQFVTAEDVVMNEQDDDDKNLELYNQGITEGPLVSSELGTQGQAGHCIVKELPGSQDDVSSAPGSVITLSDCFERGDSPNKMDLYDDESELCGNLGKQSFQLESRLPVMKALVEQHDYSKELSSGNGPDIQSSEDPKFFDRKPLALVTLDSGVKPTLDQDQDPCDSFTPYRGDNVNIVTRDDDENFSKCTKPSTMKTGMSLSRTGDRRIRKLLASKYWRVAPKLKDGDRADTELHCVYRSRKIGFKRQRSQRIYPFKKRKCYHYNSLSISDGDFGYKGVYDSHEKGKDAAASGFGGIGYGVNGLSPCVAGQSTNFPCRESHVKLRIRSFRVPEFFIDMPETATIGSLKRTVMETVTALLGSGLHVGVVLQGKKIRDDDRTLLQSGICHDDQLDSLGFTLEPSPSQISQPGCSENNSHLFSTDVIEPLSRFTGTNTTHMGTSQGSPDQAVTNNSGNLIESDHDSTPSPVETSTDKGTVVSQALVSIPEGTPQALAVVPADAKSKRSDLGQRRIRRPFSVAEVEALVQAVEKLGTGRWRDVKLQAFDNVKHRTYVDLKDKWKTLVHTARISPQQRRGEPVPQELLDRVLAAHAYWSQQQAKQQLKQQSEAWLL